MCSHKTPPLLDTHSDALGQATPHANLFSALQAAFAADRQACAVETDSGLHYSWQDLDDATAMVANLLQSLGLPPGARVVAQVEKSVEAMVLYLATLRAGLVFVPLNTAYQRAEMAYFIQDAEPAVLVCTVANFGWLSTMAFVAGCRHVFTLSAERTGSLLERAVHCARTHAVAAVRPDDLAAIIYTSGTTGRSKGAMLTHNNLLSNARVLQRLWAWRSPAQGGDVLLHVLPIFHVHGLFVAVHGALINGSKMIWCSAFSPRSVVHYLPQATVLMGVPTMYVRLLAEPGLTPAATAGMRLFISGSAPMRVDTFDAWQQRTGHTILERYGMSETGMLTSNPCLPQDGARRGGTVGRPLPGVALRVHDDAGATVGVGGIGGIQVRGPNVFKGYWRKPDQTFHAFTPDGFFITGDVGRVDADGYLTIVGRSKDLIISGGYNVYPAELEAAINALPGVEESAVVGVPDADWGEVGVAVVVAKPGHMLVPANILLALKTTVANFKVPKRVEVVAALPRNAMGKVQKNMLRAQYGHLLGTGASG